jgi:hypothetical protein
MCTCSRCITKANPQAHLLHCQMLLLLLLHVLLVSWL